ncbi:MAG: glycoside hydrolase family 3 C-terminal domain-containing protein [Deltaproteobacteria bacterium]|nr:glycoside hydrolase family 3 C-terminal domain-containing protein [Deltaproteobacteria bacterium]
MSTQFSEAAARVRAGADARKEARQLVAQMTLDEKLGCLDGDTPFWDGLIDSIRGGYFQHPWPAAAVPRLGIPGIQFSDGPRGIVLGKCTAFPVSMARGATFAPDLEERIGEAIGRELRAVGATYYGGVCVNLLRHPAWGRAQETYGEDPFHVGEMGAALACGIQNYGLACVKHFACNSMENARFKVDVTADERALHEVYLPHFKRVVDAGVASVMSAYNSVNGDWCGQNRELLTTILRDEWGFDGFVISDFQMGLRDAVQSVEAGLDIEMPYLQLRHQNLPAAVADGRLLMEAVERSVERTVATLLRFAHLLKQEPQETAVIACAPHRDLAREAAQKSIVLLRNEGGVLPLDGAKLQRVAVIGELSAKPNIGDGGSSNVHPPHIVTPLEGLRAALPHVDVTYDDGTDLARASAAAAEADVVLAVVGYTHRDEGEFIPRDIGELFQLFPPMTDPTTPERLRDAIAEATSGGGFSPGGDRARLTLSEGQEVLIETLAAANPRTIVAVMGGSAVIMERWRQRVAALLLLWYPGMEGGHALADVLLGKVNPSGRLPFVIPTKSEHLPRFDRDANRETYDLWHGQWKLDRDGNQAAYSFGFGLSYTTFALEDPQVTGKTTEGTVTVKVRNTGSRAGATVVQVYGGLPKSGFERPPRRLLGFTRVEIDAGETRRVEIPVSLRTIAVRQNGQWVIEPGRYELSVAHYAGDPSASSVFVSYP